MIQIIVVDFWISHNSCLKQNSCKMKIHKDIKLQKYEILIELKNK